MSLLYNFNRIRKVHSCFIVSYRFKLYNEFNAMQIEIVIIWDMDFDRSYTH